MHLLSQVRPGGSRMTGYRETGWFGVSYQPATNCSPPLSRGDRNEQLHRFRTVPELDLLAVGASYLGRRRGIVDLRPDILDGIVVVAVGYEPRVDAPRDPDQNITDGGITRFGVFETHQGVVGARGRAYVHGVHRSLRLGRAGESGRPFTEPVLEELDEFAVADFEAGAHLRHHQAGVHRLTAHHDRVAHRASTARYRSILYAWG